jgi:hypothetical protein
VAVDVGCVLEGILRAAISFDVRLGDRLVRWCRLGLGGGFIRIVGLGVGWFLGWW